MSNLGMPEILLILCSFVLFSIVILLIPYWRIFRKAGFPPALSLLMILPIVNIIMLYFLAFSEWPSLRQQMK